MQANPAGAITAEFLQQVFSITERFPLLQAINFAMNNATVQQGAPHPVAQPVAQIPQNNPLQEARLFFLQKNLCNLGKGMLLNWHKCASLDLWMMRSI